MALIPNYWQWKSPIEAKKNVLEFVPVYGPTQTRGFGNNSPIREWELGNDDASHDNFVAMFAFWNDRYPGVSFTMFDPNLNETRTYEFASPLSYHYNHGDSYSWKVRIKEAYPYVTV